MQNGKLNILDSNAINIARGIAILSVIAAHVNQVNNSSIISSVITNGIKYFGQIGVGVFLLLGGFLYDRQEHDTFKYFARKGRTLFLPWIFCSSVTYFLSALLTMTFSVDDYFKWILGSGTWYYYIVIYVILLGLFKWIWKRDGLLFLCIILTGISLWIGEDFIFGHNLMGGVITPYLNIFNWIGFFAIGILVRRYIGTLKIKGSMLLLALAFMILGCVGLCYFEINSYFSIYAYIFEVGAGGILIHLCYYIDKLHYLTMFLEYSGKNSYCIYLLHMQIVQFLCSRIPNNICGAVLRPIIGLAIMDILILLIYKIGKKYEFVNKVLFLLGLREYKN